MSFDKVRTLDLNWKQDMLREYMTEEKKKPRNIYKVQKFSVFVNSEYADFRA